MFFKECFAILQIIIEQKIHMQTVSVCAQWQTFAFLFGIFFFKWQLQSYGKLHKLATNLEKYQIVKISHFCEMHFAFENFMHFQQTKWENHRKIQHRNFICEFCNVTSDLLPFGVVCETPECMQKNIFESIFKMLWWIYCHCFLHLHSVACQQTMQWNADHA